SWLPRTRNESSPLGERFTCPSPASGAVATKKRGCASMKARNSGVIDSMTFAILSLLSEHPVARGDDVVPEPVDRLGHPRARRVRIVPGQDLLHPACERDGGPEARDGPLDLAVVEDHAVRLVSEQPRAPFRVEARDPLRRHMDDACG